MQSQLNRLIDNIQQKKILIIGDMVADVYLHGEIERISREAPVLVLQYDKERIIPGGATNVVHNAATMGGKVWPIGLLDHGKEGTYLREMLAKKGVVVDGFLSEEGRPTVTKTRIIAGGQATVSQQVVRIDRGSTKPIQADTEQAILAYLADVLPEMDGVVMSDYGSGTITPNVRDYILAECRKLGIVSIVDSRYDIASYKHVHYVKQNEAEASDATGIAIKDEETLLKAGAMLLEMIEADGILISRGADGMSLFLADGAVHHIPVTNVSEVFDVSGAGDTVVAVMILALAAGEEPLLAAQAANLAAGIAVRKLGTATVSADELRKAARDYYAG
ncbi:MAG: carbohydrate kinase [Selenomonadales bacterium]|nr:carbohydrate kinase [Selenomonadales bacterium]MBQ2246800.1 carbohydrate kinase [Selenomonadales bacterium]MBQ5635949.1 carbohydrate kinase [Selenomonadales bacterium]MBQ5745382.1 carbohydrate kinase [Selenomonadales bacterium]